jgi:dethiobiotin synthetase
VTTARAPKGLFVTGTDTGVGKTHVACALATLALERGLTVRVYKPVETGCDPDPADALRLAAAAADPRPLAEICPVALHAPISPHAAARLEGRTIDVDLLARKAPSQADFVLVEGAGGLLSPLTDELLMADLAATIALPLLVVVDDALGAINRALLAVEAARHRKLPVAAVVLNRTRPEDPGPAAPTHAPAIAHFGGVPVLGPYPFGNTVHPLLTPLLPSSPP